MTNRERRLLGLGGLGGNGRRTFKMTHQLRPRCLGGWWCHEWKSSGRDGGGQRGGELGVLFSGMRKQDGASLRSSVKPGLLKKQGLLCWTA